MRRVEGIADERQPEILSDPAAFKTFEQNQAQLTSAPSRLMVVVEHIPT
jgi:hypothetical protein